MRTEIERHSVLKEDSSTCERSIHRVSVSKAYLQYFARGGRSRKVEGKVNREKRPRKDRACSAASDVTYCLADAAGAALPQAPQAEDLKDSRRCCRHRLRELSCCADHVPQQLSLYTFGLRRLLQQSSEARWGVCVCAFK